MRKLTEAAVLFWFLVFCNSAMAENNISQFSWAMPLNTDAMEYREVFPPVFVRCEIIYDLTAGEDTPVLKIVYDLAYNGGQELETLTSEGNIFAHGAWVPLSADTPATLCAGAMS